MRSALLAVLPLALVAGCGDNEDPIIDPLSCEAEWDPHCDHPIDRLMVPRLRAAGIPLQEGGADERCRRAYLDLLDRGPTLEERAACAEAPFGEVVSGLLAAPEHERTWRARWGEVLGIDFSLITNSDVADLDDLVGAMERGDLAYRDFAAALATHPGLVSLHPDDDWSAALFPILLGRPARADEIAGLRPLVRMWFPRFYVEGAVWWNLYREGVEELGLDDPTAVDYAEQNAENLSKVEWAINPCMCSAYDGAPGCSSDTLGTRVALTTSCNVADNPYDGRNVYRARELLPGLSDECPDGTRQAGCADRELDFSTLELFPMQPWPALDAGMRAELDGLGAAFAARNDFWEAAADRELRWLLGWWQTTFRHPDSDLPEVRALLAAELRAGATTRDLRELIATSLLYNLPATPPAGADAAALPPWTMAPTKLLAAEGWLRTAAASVGERAGTCDHRFVIPGGGYDYYYLDERYLAYDESTLEELFEDEEFSIYATVGLGGCNADDQRPTQSNIGLTFNQADLARRLCAYGQDVVPPGWSGDLADAVDHLAGTVLARASDDVERGELVGELQACMAADGAEPACADPESAVRWLCRRMLDSAEFATY